MKKNLIYIFTILASIAIGAILCRCLMSSDDSNPRPTVERNCRLWFYGYCASHDGECDEKPNEPCEGPDPSLQPLFDYKDELSLRYRFVADFNGNGLEDVALSDDYSTFGTGGGSFRLFLQITNGVYRLVGDFCTYPRLSMIRVKPIDYDVRVKAQIWTFSRHGGGEGETQGNLFCDEIDDENNFSSTGRIAYYQWDDLCDRVFDAVFGHPHSVPIRLEYSNSTNALGEAVWVLKDSYTPPKDEPENPPAAEEE